MKHIALFALVLAWHSTGCNRSTAPVATQETTRTQSGSSSADAPAETKLSSPTIATEDAQLDKYFERYCNYTGGMGIGFVASHTYDYKFRQHLKSTEDKELKRLFVLWHLYRDVGFAMRDYEDGQIRIGKAEYRQMTPDEKTSAKKRLLEMLDDLEKFGPDDPEREIAQQRAKLN